MKTEGIVIRVGSHWGAPSIAWARRRLAYRGQLYPVVRERDFELWVQGDVKQAVTTEGVHLVGVECHGTSNLRLDELYAGGRFDPEVADRFPMSLFVACDPGRRRIEILSGQFVRLEYPYAVEGTDVLLTPELKALSNLPGLKSANLLPSGSLLTINGKTPPRLDDLRYDFGEEPSGGDYEAAKIRCRELMETALDRELNRLPSPLALSFSGGIDSSILAYLLQQRGASFQAFHTWFDNDDGEVPLDLQYARRVARDLGFPLHEVRVTREETLSNLARSIYYGERPNLILISSSLYYIPLLGAIRAAGFKTRIAADGIDTFFGGFEVLKSHPESVDFRRLYLRFMREAHSRHIPSFQSLLGVGLSEPFNNEELLRFALSLPMQFLTHWVGERFYGKRIVRDAFRGAVPDYVLQREKGLPGDVNGAREMLERYYGGSGPYNRACGDIQKRVLKPIDLGRWPAWAVHAGLRDHVLRRRMRLANERAFRSERHTGAGET